MLLLSLQCRQYPLHHVAFVAADRANRVADVDIAALRVDTHAPTSGTGARINILAERRTIIMRYAMVDDSMLEVLLRERARQIHHGKGAEAGYLGEQI